VDPLVPPELRRPVKGASTAVRITNDARKCVVFLGLCGIDSDPATFKAAATGFLIRYTSMDWEPVYLVTAKHCIGSLGDEFSMRINTKTGALVQQIGNPAWIFHDDSSVDLAVLEFVLPSNSDCVPYPFCTIPTGLTDENKYSRYGPGDLTYTVGLFRAHGGRARNIPLVHTGHIAAFSAGEKIEVEDDKMMDVYIVQCSAMPGASGSPVFARSTVRAMDDHTHDKRGGVIESSVVAGPFAYGGMSLLGVWRSSWELRQEDYVAGARIRYPAGYGSVVPGEKILEILDMPKVKDKRDKAMKKAQDAYRAKKKACIGGG